MVVWWCDMGIVDSSGSRRGGGLDRGEGAIWHLALGIVPIGAPTTILQFKMKPQYPTIIMTMGYYDSLRESIEHGFSLSLSPIQFIKHPLRFRCNLT